MCGVYPAHIDDTQITRPLVGMSRRVGSGGSFPWQKKLVHLLEEYVGTMPAYVLGLVKDQGQPIQLITPWKRQ
jgi:hypothetical protein